MKENIGGQMTVKISPEQVEARYERIAIMMIDGGLTEAEAVAYCNSKPDVYGVA